MVAQWQRVSDEDEGINRMMEAIWKPPSGHNANWRKTTQVITTRVQVVLNNFILKTVWCISKHEYDKLELTAYF